MRDLWLVAKDNERLEEASEGVQPISCIHAEARLGKMWSVLAKMEWLENDRSEESSQRVRVQERRAESPHG